MVGASPKFHKRDLADLVTQPGANGRLRWRSLAAACVVVPLSLTLPQCSRAPSTGQLAVNIQDSSADTFEDRFPAPAFRDRFPSASESLALHPMSDFAPARAAQAARASYRVASLGPDLPYQRPTLKEDLTTLVSMKSSGAVSSRTRPCWNSATMAAGV